jgi:hypothetical protein
VDETRQQATPADDGWPQRPGQPWGAGQPWGTGQQGEAAQLGERAQPVGIGQPGGSRWDARPDLRVSDAERDAVVTELGEHFQQGRLDQAEFDERVTQALAARTESDLSGPLTDLPSLRETPSAPQPRTWAPRLPFFVPLLFVTILFAGSATNGRHGGWVLWPLLWVIPIIVLRFAWWRRGSQRR